MIYYYFFKLCPSPWPCKGTLLCALCRKIPAKLGQSREKERERESLCSRWIYHTRKLESPFKLATTAAAAGATVADNVPHCLPLFST